MRKRWWIVIYGETEGPYNIRGLKRHPDISCDTLAKKMSDSDWKKMGDIPELKKVFSWRLKHPPKKKGRDYKKGKGGILALHVASNHPIFWALVVLVALLYLLYWWVIR